MAMIGNGMFGQEFPENWPKHIECDIVNGNDIGVKSIRGGGMVIPVSVNNKIKKRLYETSPVRALMEYVIDE